ncbi:hypothetical protein VNO78_28899 [Psophocarpus tetragonolobus]|uniref:Uncharacterized protein n=1 Tax=Psophocarpus tetragonolobus TaxID=3891 RepID=A0AAN9RU28_PSOTE
MTPVLPNLFPFLFAILKESEKVKRELSDITGARFGLLNLGIPFTNQVLTYKLVCISYNDPVHLDERLRRSRITTQKERDTSKMGFCCGCFGVDKRSNEEERLASEEARAKAAEAAQKRQEKFENSAAGRAARAQQQAMAKQAANSNKGEPVLKIQCFLIKSFGKWVDVRQLLESTLLAVSIDDKSNQNSMHSCSKDAKIFTRIIVYCFPDQQIVFDCKFVKKSW